MRFASHSVGLVVLLALLVGHASVAVHVATHDSGDFTECNLCFAHNDSSEAPGSCHDHEVPWVSDSHALPIGLLSQTPTFAIPVRQRGPPSIH